MSLLATGATVNLNTNQQAHTQLSHCHMQHQTARTTWNRKG